MVALKLKFRTTKLEQVHFISQKEDETQLKADFKTIKTQLLKGSRSHFITIWSKEGDVLDMEIDRYDNNMKLAYFQLKVSFETCDSMGANFINSCLEEYASTLRDGWQ